MPSISLPDATKFDSDTDTIKESRPELKTMADAVNTIGAEYNAGTLGGSGVEFPFTTNTFQITMGGKVTLPFQYATNFIEVGFDDNDSTGNTGNIEIALDNWTGSGFCNMIFFTAPSDGSGGGSNSLDVNYTYGGSTVASNIGTSATGTVLIRLNAVLFPPQTQYASNYNLDIRVFTSTIGVSVGNYYIDSAGGR